MKFKFASILSCLLLVHCHTHIEGVKLNSDGREVVPTAGSADRVVPIPGVPAQLLKPQFKLTPTKEGDKIKYTLSTEAVPDPDHRYTVNLDPATLSDSSLDITFGSKGNITSFNPTTTSKVAETITAIGDFTVDALKVAALGVFDESGGDFGKSPLNLLVEEIDENIKSAPSESKAEWANRMKPRLEFFGDDTQKFHAQYHDATKIERQLLQQVANDAEKALASSPKKSKYLEDLGLFDNLIKEIESAAENEPVTNKKQLLIKKRDAAKSYRDKIKLYVSTANISKFDELKRHYNAISLADKNEQFEPDPPDPDRFGLSDLFASAELLLKTDQMKLFGLVQPILRLPMDKWRWRHVQYLERLIKEATRKIVSETTSLDGESNDTDLEKYYQEVNELKRRRIEVLLNEETYKQWDVVRLQLESIPNSTTSSNGEVIATRIDVEAYKEMRSILSSIESQITIARTTLKSKGGPGANPVLDTGTGQRTNSLPRVGAPLPEPQIVQHFYSTFGAHISKDYIPSMLRKLGYTDPSKYPDFVLAIERAYTPKEASDVRKVSPDRPSPDTPSPEPPDPPNAGAQTSPPNSSEEESEDDNLLPDSSVNGSGSK